MQIYSGQPVKGLIYRPEEVKMIVITILILCAFFSFFTFRSGSLESDVEADGTSLKKVISGCAFCDIGRNDACFLDCRTVCEYYRIMLCVDVQSCLSAQCYIFDEQTNTHLKPGANVPESRLIEQANLSLSSVTEIVGEYIGKNAGFSASEIAFESVEKLIADTEITEDTLKVPVRVLPDAVSIDGDKKASGETKSGRGESQQASLEHSGVSVPSLASKDYHLNDRRQPCRECLSEEVIQNQNENLGLVHDQVETGAAHIVTGQVNPVIAVHRTSGQEQSNVNLQYRTSEQKVAEHKFSKISKDKDESSLKEIFADISSKTDHGKDYELDSISLDEMTFQKLSPRGKESAFLRLKNRIKLLEVNLNLTNR